MGTSPISRTPGLTREDTGGVTGFEGAADILRAWLDGLRPPPPLSVSQWADQFRYLPTTSAEPGRWRTSRTPYLREIMDCLSPESPWERVVFQKGTQVGGSEAGLNWLGYIIHHAPGLVLLVQPSLDMVKRNTVTRIDPMIAETSVLRDLVVTPRSREPGNSLFRKAFPAGELVMAGANSAAALRSTPARYLFLDEVDGYPGDVDGEGDPVDLAIRRTATFRNRRKILMVSTPTRKGASRIEAAYLESDQRLYEVPCPHCGTFAPITWARIRWSEGRRAAAFLVCDTCGATVEDYEKPALLAAGRWRATAPGDGKTAGFHLSGLYSPWDTWGDIAVEHGQVKTDPPRLQVWVNTRLGETWEDRSGEHADTDSLIGRVEPLPPGLLPSEALLITAGVDVQPDRLEVTICAWGALERCWVLEHSRLPGDPQGPAVWKALDTLLARTWTGPHHSAPVLAVAIDSGGSNTMAVYEYVRPRQGARRWAIKGASHPGMPLWPSKAGRNNKGKVPLYVLNVDAGKDVLLGRLGITERGPGHIAFADTLGPDYFAQLTAEVVRTRYSKGRPVREWVLPAGKRNEALDCWVYAYAAVQGLKALGLDLEATATALTKTPAVGKPRRTVGRQAYPSDYF